MRRARKAGGFSIKIEVECQDLTDALEAAQTACDVIMLDNMQPEVCPFSGILQCSDICLCSDMLWNYTDDHDTESVVKEIDLKTIKLWFLLHLACIICGWKD